MNIHVGSSPLIFLTFEVGSRELLPRTALACALARRGATAVVSHKRDLEVSFSGLKAGSLQGSVYVYKDCNREAIRYLGRAKELGMVTVTTDEELINFLDVVPSVEAHINQASIPFVDFHFAGSETTADFSKNLGLQTVEAGNLRIGLAELIGRTTVLTGDKPWLVTSPTGTIFNNSPLGLQLRINKQLGVNVFETVRDIITAVRDDANTLVILLSLLRLLNDKQINVRFRPHPSEDFTLAELLGAELKFSVSNSVDSSSISDILKSRGVVGFNCATLLEAYAMNIPIINLGKFRSDGIPTATGKFIESVEFNRILPIFDYRLESLTSLQPNFGIKGLNKHLLIGNIFDRWCKYLLGLAQEKCIRPVFELDLQSRQLDKYQSRKRGRLHPLELQAMLLLLKTDIARCGAKVTQVDESTIIAEPVGQMELRKR